jgi:hypothetical protein
MMWPHWRQPGLSGAGDPGVRRALLLLLGFVLLIIIMGLVIIAISRRNAE